MPGAGRPVAGSKRWWWRPLGSNGLAIPAEVAIGAVGKGDGAGEGLRRGGAAEADAPGAAFGMTAERADLADVEQDVAHAGVLQQRRHAVGDVALRDAVERDRHAGPREADFRRLDLHGAVVHQRPRLRDLGLGRPARSGARLREVGGVEAPERLHGGVEGALRPLGEDAGLRQQGDEVQGGRRDAAVAVEAGERAQRPGRG